MKPWQLGNKYDRPIPRRIVEEAGVSREMFGIAKHGAGVSMHLDSKRGILHKLSKTAQESFLQYLKENRQVHTAEMIQFYEQTAPLYIRQFLRKAHMKKIAKLISFDRHAISMIENPTDLRYVMPWASEIIRKRYENILAQVIE